VVNPRSGALANANNRSTDAPFPRHLGHRVVLQRQEAVEGVELARRQLLLDALDPEGQVPVMGDVAGKGRVGRAVSEMARAVLPIVARDLWWRGGQEAARPTGPEARRAEALALLADWSGAMDRHRPEPLIFAEWMRQLTLRLAEDELGPLMPLVAGLRPLFVERAFRDIDGAGVWCDITKTPEVETCDEMAARALDDALARLGRDYGTNLQGWRWGAAHEAVHVHTPLGFVFPLGALVSIRQETSGGFYTVLRGAMSGRGDTPFENVHASGLRMVLDFADLDRSRIVIATGQSGHPLSRHYDDLSTLWVRGDTIPMSMDDGDARLGALGEMVLDPRP
ncbi:MAG: penicillin acylase family protein, partial [Pseudomonadota bacterium]